MKATLLRRIFETYGRGRIEGMIWAVPEPVPPAEHCVKYRLVYVVDGVRVIGYDNERGKGDHKYLGTAELPYVFTDVPALLRDFIQDLKEWES
jgi:Family of unknown function (DUF6516)